MKREEHIIGDSFVQRYADASANLRSSPRPADANASVRSCASCS